jgi:N-acetylmuramoyl-L-alanine amidase
MRDLITLSILVGLILTGKYLISNNRVSGAPPYGEPEENAPAFGSIEWINSWERPHGPAKVALQIGHWKNAEFPDELDKLRGNSGASGGSVSEWEVNLAIAQETEKLLKERDIDVEIIPATVPPSYWADVFVAIHADGSTDLRKRGFKVAAPWRDFSREANELVENLEIEYQKQTNYEKDPNITRNMRGYYAFSWWRYEHAIHPMTTAAIIETGFLTNVQDRRLIVGNPEIPALGIANGIISFLKSQELIYQ